MKGQKPVKMFTLSTCSHCKATKKFMKDNNIDFDYTDVDLLSGAEQGTVLDEVKKYNPRFSFPTILIGRDVIVGFQETEIRKALGI
ncbi:MAG TPA: glutaredoxin family protein [bacterium]|nr:glutaredoxin family protein [bacterium]